ncbi:glycosyltransferase [Rhodohalobacter sp. 8-1]|uniref:glycosyltransferase n=1 Tax=Rhodohalobacter sp. 8-1 TaxID=3131972 RepID=UPI0030EBC3D0
MERMQISVAIATFNGAKYLEAQLESILGQTRQPDELVISDDNSTDNTIEIIENFKINAPFEVKLLINPNNGYNSNFQNAFKNSTGDFIFICDQDDYWFKTKIEDVSEYFKDNPDCYLIIHDLQYTDMNLNPLPLTKVKRFKKFRNLDNYVTGMATTVRRELLNDCLPIPNGVNYDTWLHNIALNLGKRCIYEKVLSLYRRHESNATKSNIINSSSELTLNQYIWHKINNDSLYNAKRKKKLYLALINWIKKKEFEKSSLVSCNTTLKKRQLLIKDTLKTLDERINLLKKNIITRFIPLSLLYLKGGYTYFSGFMTYIKDIISTSKK